MASTPESVATDRQTEMLEEKLEQVVDILYVLTAHVEHFAAHMYGTDACTLKHGCIYDSIPFQEE
jgi:hypothetical protein